MPPTDVLANAATLEYMVISDPHELATAGGATSVDLTEPHLPKAAVGACTVDKGNEGA